MRVALFVAVLLVAGCDESGLVDRPNDHYRYEGQLDATLRAIDLVIDDAAASDRSACRVLTLSEDPCGNPSFFRIYSAEGDTASLFRLAEEYDRLRREYEKVLGQTRECRVVDPPEIVYDDGRCTMEPRAVE